MRARLLTVGLLAAALLAGPVAASDTPLRAPIPAWVAAVADPAAAADPSGAPVRISLIDQQVRFDDQGKHLYLRMRIHIRSAQGLAAGTVAAAWSPATQTLTVHHVRILRNDAVIDALEGREFDILRREQNLDSAMYDGVLTATLQPRDLRVGDTLELAYTLTTRDPVLGDHAEHLTLTSLPFPVTLFSTRISWPDSTPMRLRAAAPLEEPRIVRDGPRRTVALDLHDLQPLNIPGDAPSRFHHARLLELSDYAGWGDMGRTLAPLYQRAAVLAADSPLLAEVERIRAEHETTEDRVSAALRLVQDNVRYVAFVMGEAGLTPASADAVWEERLGDCKGKTVLLMALLRQLGVEAEAVAVSTVMGDGLNERLPMAALLDHVIVRTVVDGRTYWLDGARSGDPSIALAPPLPYSWALPLTADSQGLQPIPLPPLDRPMSETIVSVDASAGLDAPAPTRAETVMRGDEALNLHLALQSVSTAERDEFMRLAWSADLPGFVSERFEVAYDPDQGELRLAAEGRLPLNPGAAADGRRRFEPPTLRPRFAFAGERSPGPYAELPVSIAHPMYVSSRIAVTLPGGGAGYVLAGDSIEQEIGGIMLQRLARIEDGRFIGSVVVRSLRSEATAAEAAQARTDAAALRSNLLWVQAPADYVATEQDLEALRDRQPSTAEEHVAHALALQRAGDVTAGLQALDQAVALAPDDAQVLATRGYVRLQAGDLERARADLDRASDIDPAEPAALYGLGLLALIEGREDDAIIEFSRVLRQKRGDVDALTLRGQAYVARGDTDRALADFDAALVQAPDNLHVRTERYNVLARAGRDAEALAEIDRLIAMAPEDDEFPVRRITLAQRVDGDEAAAMAALNALLETRPSAPAHLARERRRSKTDLDGRRADLDHALALEPENPEAWSRRVLLEIDAGSPADALPLLDDAIDGLGDEAADLRLLRAQALIAADRHAEAEADIAAVRAQAQDSAHLLNNLCWTLATEGVFLEQALADCNGALALNPDTPAYLDSRGMALLHLGRPAEALADYEAALARAPRMAPALYGRAFARRALGQVEAARADFEAAAAIDADARTPFRIYEEKHPVTAD